MIVLCCILATLVQWELAQAQQVTCETIPSPGNPCIMHNAMTQAELGPLYPEDATVIVFLQEGENTGVDVTDGVEIYMDCSNLTAQLTQEGGILPDVYFYHGDELVTNTSDPEDFEILGDNSDLLHIFDTMYAVGAEEGIQGTYFCYVCPFGTPTPAPGGSVDSACIVEGSVLITDLPDLPEVCTESEDVMPSFVDGEIAFKPGRGYICINENPNGNLALIEGMTGGADGNFLQFVCTLVQGLEVPEAIQTASFNGQDIFANGVAIANEPFCPMGPQDIDGCGVFQYNEELVIGIALDGVTNDDIESYYGNFTCTITVPNVDVSVSASVIASNCEPPTISNGSSAVPAVGDVVIGSVGCHVPGTTTNIICNVTVTFGTPYNVTWDRDGMQVAFTQSNESDTHSYSATSPGTYTCTASNDFGMDSASSILYGPIELDSSAVVIQQGNDGCSRIEASTLDICPAVGELIGFTCQHSDTVPSILQTLAGDVTLYDNTNTPIGPPRIVTFSDPSQNGVYSCRATNPVCSNSPAAMDFAVDVHEPPQINPNYQAMSAVDIGVDVVGVAGQSAAVEFVMGGSLALVCAYTGIDTPSAQWSLDGNVIDDNNPRISISTDPDDNDPSVIVSTLIITNLMSSDVGIYGCSATNNVLNAEPRENVTVVQAAVPTTMPPTTMPPTTVPPPTTVMPVPVLTITILSNERDISSSSCGRLRPVPSDIDSCPYVGENVIISCVSDPPGFDVTLRLPNGDPSVEDTITAPNIQPGDVSDGRYVCELGNATDAQTLQLYDPPTILRNVPLPDSPNNNTVVIGVGRAMGTPDSIQSGMDVNIFCPFTGLDDPSATFLRLVEGMFVEIENETDKYLIVADTNGLVLTIMDFTEEDAGTYRCEAINAAGDSADESVLILERDSIWVVTPWSACDPDCHKGQRVRKVMCRETPGNKLLPDSECPFPKPRTTEQCIYRGPCYLTPEWSHGDWSECTVSCGGGTRGRDVFCIIPLTGVIVDDSNCRAHSAAPHNKEICNSHACCFGDYYPDFCAMIRGTSTCTYPPYDVYCCWSCSQSQQQY